MQPQPPNPQHRHEPTTVYVLDQREGVPYEVEQVVCAQCRQVLGERPLRRAAA